MGGGSAMADDVVRAMKTSKNGETNLASKVSFTYKYALILQCLPVSILSTVISIVVMWMRRNPQMIDPSFMTNMEHPYASQTLGIVTAFLLVLRLNMAIDRWRNALDKLDLALAKWAEAYLMTMAFLEWSSAKPSQELQKVREKLTHWYSLLFNIGALTLYNAEGRAFGALSRSEGKVAQVA